LRRVHKLVILLLFILCGVLVFFSELYGYDRNHGGLSLFLILCCILVLGFIVDRYFVVELCD